MDYKKAIDLITTRRKSELLESESLFIQALKNYPELYDIEIKLREENLKAMQGKASDTVKIQKTKTQIIDKLDLINVLYPPPHCNKCNDKGFIDDNICSCVKNIIINSMDKANCLPLHSFSESDESKFSDSTKKQMNRLYDIMRNLCSKFPNTNAKNIILSGSSGTGKTFLASCVANELINNGFSVVFISAFDFNNRMLKYHTTFDIDKMQWLSPLLDCDMLIIDDLGTESILKNVTIEYTYLVLNERLNSNKHSMITSNLDFDQIGIRYGERIASRIFDKRICFTNHIDGKDIRKL